MKPSDIIVANYTDADSTIGAINGIMSMLKVCNEGLDLYYEKDRVEFLQCTVKDANQMWWSFSKDETEIRFPVDNDIHDILMSKIEGGINELIVEALSKRVDLANHLVGQLNPSD